MIPIPPTIKIIVAILCVIAGMLIGGVTGWLVSLFTRTDSRWVFKDALIGSLGFLVGYFGCFVFRWRENTVTFKNGNDVEVMSTSSHYQHPERVALFMAIVLPALYRMSRHLIVSLRQNNMTRLKSE